MGKVHGKGAHFALDLADGTGPSAISSVKLRRIGGLPGKTDRPPTDGFGDDAPLYEVVGKQDGGPISLTGVWQKTAGTPIHGRQARVMWDEFALSGRLRSLQVNRQSDLPGSDGFGDDFIRHEVLGKRSGSLSVGGIFDSAAGLSDAVLRAALAAASPSVVSIAPAGFGVGQLVEVISPYETSYVIDAEHGTGPVPVQAEFVPNGLIDLGVSLHDATAETGVMNGTTVDESAQTTSGWVAHLHVSAFTGTNATLKLQDSADGAVWADLTGGAFTLVTGVTKERLTGAATATVRRYVRVIISAVTVLTSITFVATIARRGSTYGAAGTYRHFFELLGHANSQTFQYGPEGSSSGKRRVTGESRLQSLSVNYQHDQGPVEYSAELVTDSTVTLDTF